MDHKEQDNRLRFDIFHALLVNTNSNTQKIDEVIADAKKVAAFVFPSESSE